ncbi:CrcB-like protein-domain-containing protein [Obelidium mucronatum]|nr:CrcB-like protein-domain-containing protein [Obelidium mucronatum]
MSTQSLVIASHPSVADTANESFPLDALSHQTERENNNVPQSESPVVTASAICFFSVLGVLIRIELNDVNTYLGQPVFSLAWAQIIGCFLFGLIQRNKSGITLMSPSLYVGLTTGLCGTITTFSAFILSLFEAITGSPSFLLKASSFRFQNICNASSLVVITIGMAIVSLRFGQTVATSVLPPIQQLPSRFRKQPTVSSSIFRQYGTIDFILLILGIVTFGIVLVTCFLAYIQLDEEFLKVALSCMLGPFGALIRWKASLLLNKRNPHFPWGTFVVNVVGSFLRAASQMIIVRDLNRNGIGWVGMCWLVAVNDGFTGGLTTLSTLANELENVIDGVKEAGIYLGASVIVSLAIIAVLVFPWAVPV